MNKRKNKPLLRTAVKKYRVTLKVLKNHKGESITGFYGGKRYVSEVRIPYGIRSCSLCCEFLWDNNDCTDCCIREDTGKNTCKGTPYKKFENLVLERKTVTQGLINATKAELDYLEDLYQRLYNKKVE